MITLSDFLITHPIRDTMLWKEAALGQLKNFELLAESFGVKPNVIATHTSKSIDLPVVMLELRGGTVVIRDNFHDVNVAIAWRDDFTSRLLASALYPTHDWDWYLNEVARSRNYSYRGWTDEEMDDPRILRVQVTNVNGHVYMSEVRGEKKDRWIRRLTDPAWYEHDWASGYLIADGPLGPDCKLRRLDCCFLEGMSDLSQEMRKPWRPGMTHGALCLPSITMASKLFAILEAGP